MRVIFAGGGTGGHLYPGLAIARALVKADKSVEPFFIGAQRGIERDVLPQVGFPFELLDLHPLYRSRPWENWKTIRDEALKLFDEGHIRAAAGYTDLGFNSFFRRGWKRFYVKWYDAPLPSAQALCPNTVALVQSIKNVNGAMFALLPPGGDLGKHRDPFAGSLRYHLGLVTPNSDSCKIWVDGEPYYWRDGEAVMFDETFIHWAENKSDVTRLILFCDVERPLKSRIMAKINHWFEATAIRASQTENAPGDQIGVLNRIFSVVYYLRLPGKALKKKSRLAYYATKWLLVAGILYLLLR